MFRAFRFRFSGFSMGFQRCRAERLELGLMGLGVWGFTVSFRVLRAVVVHSGDLWFRV